MDSGASCEILTLNHTIDHLDCKTYLKAIQNPESNDVITTQCPHEHLIFDHSVVEDSIVTEYGLTCDSKFIKNVIGAIYMVGLMVGSFGFGILSDVFGRKKALMTGFAMTSISGILGAFMPNEILFGAMRFLSGLLHHFHKII